MFELLFVIEWLAMTMIFFALAQCYLHSLRYISVLV